ncbi:hypothetical protein IEQ34_021919 [Dendrobium chrysotoxum]|uniref:Uncharacterized protein n=1 Tax=Dendrobium chrysotoxum TaxID=161865 RepID=A0AAV7FWA1_DENCH|nr:hypothetical protein IEQ34_021919 [Dendrobium chrysotoxum]
MPWRSDYYSKLCRLSMTNSSMRRASHERLQRLEKTFYHQISVLFILDDTLYQMHFYLNHTVR